MCWHICNNCNGAYARPCIMFVPNDDATGLTGCPYHIYEETNEDLRPACWIALKAEEVKKYIQNNKWFEKDDEEVNDEEYRRTKKTRKEILEG